MLALFVLLGCYVIIDALVYKQYLNGFVLSFL